MTYVERADEQANDVIQPFADSVVQAIRNNPMSAAAIGMGVAWMVFGRKIPSLEDIVGLPRRAADLATSAAQNAVQAANDMVGGVEPVDNAPAPKRGPKGKRPAPKSATTRDALSELFQKQPLALGAIGVAIGAGLASALPNTKIEHDLLGDHAVTLQTQVRALVDDGISQATALKDDMLREADAQGLNAAAVTDAAKQVGTAAAAVFQAGKTSLSGNLPGSKSSTAD